MAISGQLGAGYGALTHDGQRAGQVLGQRGAVGRLVGCAVKRQHFVQQAGIASGGQVIGQHQQGPEHDVAMRITRAHLGIARVEHEPLRPVAIGVLGAKHPAQQAAHQIKPAQGLQQLYRALADIAGAPAAARELLQPTR